MNHNSSNLRSNELTKIKLSLWKTYEKNLKDFLVEEEDYLEVNESYFEEFK